MAKRYPKEFRDDVVKVARLHQAPMTQIAKDFGISDSGLAQFVGAAPPAGHGEHRYFISVHALDVADIQVPAEASPAFFGFNLNFHTLARATIVARAEIKESVFPDRFNGLERPHVETEGLVRALESSESSPDPTRKVSSSSGR